jgi:hypothetical protein
MEDLLLEDFYRKNFQVIHKDEANMLPSLVIRDINGDGLLEIVAESFQPTAGRSSSSVASTTNIEGEV